MTIEEISKEDIAKACNINIGSVKNTLRRMEQAEILIRESFTRGHWGGTSFTLPQELYQEILELEASGKIDSPHGFEHNKNTHYDTLSDTTSLYSSSININTTTNLPDEWNFIDYGPLAKINFGLLQLQQLYNFYTKNQNQVSAQEVQESINQFAFDLNENNKIQSKKKNAKFPVFNLKLRFLNEFHVFVNEIVVFLNIF